MKPVVVIPAKPFSQGKSRLAAALGAQARAVLSERLFRYVLGVATSIRDEADCLVVSAGAEVLALARQADARGHAETAPGHNAALAGALARLTGPVLILSADLPLLEPDDLQAMLATPDALAIAPDHAGEGTNALYLPTPSAIAPRFGPGSRALHEAAARAAGFAARIVERPGLAFDVDEPGDLERLPSHF